MTKIYPGRESVKCDGHSKRPPHLPCKNWAVAGRTKCKYHGGMSLQGIATPNYIDGRYSKFAIPPALRENYLAALNDPNLLRLRDDIALIDAHLGEMLEKLDKAETGATWLALSKAYQKLTYAKTNNQPAIELQAMQELQRAIEIGVGDLEMWQEIHVSMEQRRRLVSDEHKTQVRLKQMMSAEKAMGLLGLVVDSIRRAVNRHCEDKKQAQRILQAVSADLNIFVNVTDSQPRLALREAVNGE